MLQTFNVPAGGRLVNAKARFFRFESVGVDGADQVLRVRADGQDLGTYLPGDSITLPVDATTWELTPASATQTAIVRLGIATVQAARLVGFVTVTNKIGAGVQQVEGFGGGLLPNGFLSGTVAVAAGLNPRGLLIRRCGVGATAGGGGTSEIRMIAAPTQPVTTVPANAYQMCATAGGAGVVVNDSRSDLNYQLPAGWAIYIVTQHVTVPATSASYSLAYEPL
jgi:hypothetical protein